jgi:APA family basic amino acid/polyamine antiporter
MGIFSLGAGSMISTGIFILPALAYAQAGNLALVSYAAAGLLMLPALFAKLELATAIPKAGGTYFYLERILGTPVGIIAGVTNWFSISLKSAFALVGIGVFSKLLFAGTSATTVTLVAVGACLLFGVLNCVSARSSSAAQIAMVVVLLALLIQFVVIGYPAGDITVFASGWTAPWQVVIATTGMVFISYGGITKVASMAEEARDPKRSLVKGIVAAFVVVQVLYVLVLAVLIALMPPDELAGSQTPLSDAVRRFALPHGFIQLEVVLMAIGGTLAFITTGNAGIMSASRVPLAMSRDGLLPTPIARVSRRGAPIPAVVLTTAFMVAAIVWLDLAQLAKVASFFMLLLFTLVNFSVIVVRYSRLANYRPAFRTPFVPVLPAIGIVCYIALIVGLGGLPVLVGGAFIVLSLAWYFLYARSRVRRTSALVHLTKQLTAPELGGEPERLENELLDILMDREQISEDRFDLLVREAAVIDLDRTMERDDVFMLVANELSRRWGLAASMLFDKLVEREEQASTLVYPGVAVPHAIPHLVVEEEHPFQLVLVRNRFGIRWNDQGDIVYTAFVLAGSKSERDFHLRALMSIAQLLQDPEFHPSWHRARSERELRSAVLLAKRNRQQGRSDAGGGT